MQDKTRQDKTRQDPVTDESMDLLSRAQAVMQEKAVDPLDVSTLPTKELQGLVHELQVHHIELQTSERRTQEPFSQIRSVQGRSTRTFMIQFQSGVAPFTLAMVQRGYSRI